MYLEEIGIPQELVEDYRSSGITELNLPQEQAVETGVLEGEDMIVASPTASGKTLIAELAIAKRALEEGQKAVYIVPLRALASEKYEDFTERFEDLDVRISVGDRDESGDYLDTADLVIVTSEKMDSMLRHNPSWIHDIGLVCVDEIHLLTSENRGPTLEVTIARLRELLDFQLLGLSATISNSEELADWLDAELMESGYRPVELKEGIHWKNDIEFYPDTDVELDADPGPEYDPSEGSSFSTGSEVQSEEDIMESVESETYAVDDRHDKAEMNIVADTLGMDKQAIVFCSSRNGAEKSADRAAEVAEEDLSREERNQLEEYAERIESALGNPTSQCRRLARAVEKGAAFHHAGLVRDQRNAVEEAFREGLLRTVSATPTLAAGVNLPAFRVIMRDLKRYTGRGMEYIPVLEYEQMSGRAGRPEYDDRGEAISIAKQPGQREEILERYILGEAERIQSKLAVEPVLRMHTLSLVASEFTNSMEQLLEFYSETLYAHQFGDMEEVESKVKRVVETLREYGFIEEDRLKATKAGRRVSELYIDPESAHLMLECLERADGTETRAVSYLFMISRTTEIRPLRVRDSEYQEIGQALMDAEHYLLEDRAREWEPGYESHLEAMKTALMFKGWISEIEEERLMEKYDVAPGGIRAKTQHADWLLFGAQELANLEGIELEGDLKRLRTRLEHGIEEELLPLVKYDQIGRVRARELHDHGVRSRGDIRAAEFEKLKRLIGDKTARKLKKQVGEENIFDRENITDYFED